MGKDKWNKLGLVTIFTIVMCVISLVLANNVKADPRIINVAPGSGTLKAAIESEERQDGDILQLTDGYYNPGKADDKVANVSKKITIRGKGDRTIVSVPFKITVGDEKMPVKLENFSSTPVRFETDTKFINVTGSDVYLKMNNLVVNGIMRDDWIPDESSVLEVSDEADGANITLNNCFFVKAGVNYGIKVDASNTNITLENKTRVGSSASIVFNNGSGNIFNITDGSIIEGPAAQFENNKVIAINNQTELKLNISNSTVEGEYPKKYLPVKVFAFDSESKNVEVDIKNSKIGYENNSRYPSRRSTIFDFDSNITAENNNVITVDKDSSFVIFNNSSEEKLPLEDKYSKLNSASVVGIYDKDNNGVIKVYDNDTKLLDLDNPKYTELEDSIFKGWFKDIERTEEFTKDGDNYPNTQSGENMDLYPKFAKKLKVTIKNVNPDSSDKDTSYDIEEGQTISESKYGEKIKADLEKIKTKEGQDFRGYVIYNSHGNYTYEVGHENELIENLQMTENCTIEAIHRVKVTINGYDFYIESGQSLSDIKDLATDNKTSFEEAKLNGKDEDRFSRFVVKGRGTTVTESDSIPVNVELESKFLQNVTVKNVPTVADDDSVSVSDKTFSIEEGLKLDSDSSIKEALDSISGKVEGRKFDRFINSKNKEEIKRDEYTIDDDIEIEAVYTIKVKLQGKSDLEYTMEVGSNLNSLKGDNIDIVKNALTEMSKNVPGGKDFDGFVVSCDKDNTNEVFDYDTYENNLDNLIADVMNYNMSYNTTIYARYNITVTIGGEDFDLESGDSLKTGILDVKNNQTIIDKYNQAKLNGKDEDRFSRFVKEGTTDTTVGEDEEITESMTLVPKYFAFVTINDDRDNIKGTYKVEEEKTIEDLDGKDVVNGVNDAKEALFMLRSDIVPPELNATPDSENLHFEKIERIGEDKSIPSKISEDITIKGVYHYDVVIVEDYDNPINDKDNTNHRYGFKVYKGETLNSNTLDSEGKKINEALERLQTTATKEDGTRKFYSYIETNSEREFTYNSEDGTYQSVASGGKQSLLETVFNRHLFITARVQYQVKIGDKKDYVIEQHPLSEYPEFTTALESLNKEGKNIAKYTVDGKEVENNEELGNTIITKATEIGATYNVVVTIGDATFTLPEGGKLESLSAEEQGKVREALEALRATSSDHHLKGYNVGDKFIKNEDGEDIVDSIIKNETFDVNTEITPAFDVRVTIGEKHFDLDAGKSDLKTLKEMNGYNDAIKKANRKVLGFMDGENKISIDDDYTFTKDTSLTPIYGIDVTVRGKGDTSEKYTLEEGHSLNEIIDTNVFIIDGKTLSFEDENGKPVDLSKTLSDDYNKDNMTITAVYTVEIIINDYTGAEITTFTLKDTEELDSNKDWQTAVLAREKNSEGKKVRTYKGLYKDDSKVDTSEVVDVNSTFVAKYTVDVKFKNSNGDVVETITIFEGDTLEKATGEEKEQLDTLLKDEKLVKDNINTNQVFTEDTEIDVLYYKTITIGKDKFYVKEGENLQSLIDKGDLDSIVNRGDKNFVKFKKGNDDYDTSTPIKEDIELTPVYTIDVTINDYEGNLITKVTLDEGANLDSNNSWEKAVKDYENGEKTYEGLYDGDSKVKTNTKLNEHTTYTAKYTVKVSIVDKSGTTKGEFTLFQGQTLNDLADKTELNNLLDDDRLVEGSINTNQVFTKNTTITAKYYKVVTILGKEYKIEEGLPLQTLIDNGDLKSVMEPGEKHWAKFTKGGEEFKTDTVINEDTQLDIVYKIIITVQTGDSSVDYDNFVLEGDLADGVGLSDIKKVVPEHDNFLRFEYDGKEITNDTPKFENDVTIVQKYGIKISADGYPDGFNLESGQALEDLDDDVLEALRMINANGRNFSRFVDQNGKTIKENQPIYENTTIIPKYNIIITVFRRDDAGNEIEDDIVTFELGEDLPLIEVTETEGHKLQEWAKKVIEKLASEGKPNYVLSAYRKENGEPIDEKETLFSEDTRIEAVFTEKKSDTPDLGDITGKDDNNKNIPVENKNKPNKAPVPDTGKELNNIVSVVVSVFLFVVMVLLVFGPVFVLHAEKINK